MKCRYSFVLLAMVLAACARPEPDVDRGADPGAGQAVPAQDLMREVTRIVAEHRGGEDLWPGFDPLSVPLATYDGERTFLFGHPSPPRGFVEVPDVGLDAHVLDGRHEAVVANTSTEIGGVPTATVLLDARPPGRSTDLAALAIHEMFHVHQRARHPGWVANEADLFVYPTDSGELLSMRRLETEALGLALASETAADGLCWTRLALSLRQDRYARMAPAFAAYERGTELNEGLATYIQLRAAGRDTVAWPPSGFGPGDVRRRAYSTGAAIGLLLDRFAPDWKAALAARDEQTLDGMLAAAAGPGEACAFDETAAAGVRDQAQADVDALRDERARRSAEFEERPGWRVVVEVVRGEMLMPQAFDPLNVEPLGPGRILHTRMLRLGNGAGALDVLDASAVTEGAGAHPLFQGVRRVMLTGLAEPQVVRTDGRVSVLAPGLRMEFDGASVVQDDATVTVRLGD